MLFKIEIVYIIKIYGIVFKSVNLNMTQKIRSLNLTVIPSHSKILGQCSLTKSNSLLMILNLSMGDDSVTTCSSPIGDDSMQIELKPNKKKRQSDNKLRFDIQYIHSKKQRWKVSNQSSFRTEPNTQREALFPARRFGERGLSHLYSPNTSIYHN